MPKSTNAAKSNKKLYNAYFKKGKKEGFVSSVLIPMREYGMFLIPLPFAYLLFYYLVFEKGGVENGMRGFYWLALLCILAVDISAFFLRKLWRGYKFNKYSSLEVALFKGNRWRCPHCHNENSLLAPCVKCGIYPNFYKSEKSEMDKTVSARNKKLRKDYDDYIPQFK